jgi:hypothetical protein
MRPRLPSARDLGAYPPLASLALLEIALALAADGLSGWHPITSSELYDDDDGEISTACILVAECHHLRVLLGDYRRRAIARIRRDRMRDWPF